MTGMAHLDFPPFFTFTYTQRHLEIIFDIWCFSQQNSFKFIIIFIGIIIDEGDEADEGITFICLSY